MQYWFSTLYSDTEDLQGVDIGFGHQFAPLLRFEWKGLWAECTFFYGWLPFRYEDHYEVLDDTLRHDYTGQKTNARRTDWALCVGGNVARGLSLFFILRDFALEVEDAFDYEEYTLNPLTSKWSKTGDGNETYRWSSETLAWGGGLGYWFPLKRAPVFFRFTGAYLVVTGSGGYQRFNDIMSLYAGVQYNSPWKLSLIAGYQADFLGMDNIDQVNHGPILTLLIPVL